MLIVKILESQIIEVQHYFIVEKNIQCNTYYRCHTIMNKWATIGFGNKQTANLNPSPYKVYIYICTSNLSASLQSVYIYIYICTSNLSFLNNKIY
jgi:hypothetical protein